MQSRTANPAAMQPTQPEYEARGGRATTPPRSDVIARNVRGTASGFAAAMVATTVVFGIGNLGAPIRVVTGWSPNGAPLTFAELAATVATSVSLGGLLLWWMESRWPHSFSVWARVAAATAVLSAVPLLRLDVGADSKASLVTMHLLTGVCAIGAQRAVRTRREP